EFQLIAPLNAKYLQVSYPTDSFPQVEKGNKATDWTPAPEDTDAKITNNTTLIEQNADGLKLKANQDTVDTLAGTVQRLGSEFDIVAGQVSSRVWNTDIETAVDGIEIGGRNLLKGVDYNDVIMRSNNSSMFPVIDESFGSHRRVKRLFTEGITEKALTLYTFYFFDTEVGEKYTMSIKVKPEETVNLKLWNGLEKKSIKGKWTTLSNTITAKDNRERFMALLSDNIFSPDFTPWIEYKDLKAE